MLGCEPLLFGKLRILNTTTFVCHLTANVPLKWYPNSCKQKMDLTASSYYGVWEVGKGSFSSPFPATAKVSVRVDSCVRFQIDELVPVSLSAAVWARILKEIGSHTVEW